ncbi:MAG TPA: prepilin-type N-terminal cleavage/methylation domain-containing protein, partial [Elusimicrobiota bacterium]|nr:prepilin-type N-terminal cleavage/methylation domain-containing protein [Elusimicrobiota bacterium]
MVILGRTPRRFRYLRGFTLIELMLVVAIIGLLAAIAIPKFANLVVKAKEASVRGKIGSVRSAMSIYYADNEG